MTRYLCIGLVIIISMLTGNMRGDDRSAKRPVTATYSLEAGGNTIIDTYLSPLRYHGTQIALTGHWLKALPQGENMSMSFRARLEGAHAVNPAGNASEWQGAFEFDWLLRRGWSPLSHFMVSAAIGTGIYAGGIYLPRNSNNPVSAKARVAVNAALALSYHWKGSTKVRPVTFRNEAVSPLGGILFSQEYGQPYYNIYLGNRGHLVHGAWWGNNFCIDNLLSATLHLSNGDFGIGYRFRLYQQHVCHLDTRIISHAAVVYWSPKSCRCDKSAIILAVY